MPPYLAELSSKESCPICGKHKIITDNKEAEAGGTIFYHCLACNYEFCITNKQKLFSEYKEAINRKPEWTTGVLLIFSILFVILVVEKEKQGFREVNTYPSEIMSENSADVPVLEH